MRVVGKKILLKIKKKNIGNLNLCSAIDKLIVDLESFKPEGNSICETRNDADKVYSDGFYFLTLVFIAH